MIAFQIPTILHSTIFERTHVSVFVYEVSTCTEKRSDYSYRNFCANSPFPTLPLLTYLANRPLPLPPFPYLLQISPYYPYFFTPYFSSHHKTYFRYFFIELFVFYSSIKMLCRYRKFQFYAKRHEIRF